MAKLRYAVVLLVLGVLTGGCAGPRSVSDVPEVPADRRPLPVVEQELRGAVTVQGEAGAPPVPARLVDAYLRGVRTARLDSALVWEAYRRFLGDAARYTEENDRRVLRQHLALTELLYGDAPAEADLGARAAHALAWWVDQHPAPTLAYHERLMTHLRRVAVARERYPSPRSESGLDARGETYVRYGRPDRVRSVAFNEAELQRTFLRDGLPVRLNDFPENELWVYDGMGPTGLFLFVEGRRREGFELGTVNDLLPRQLRNRGSEGSVRGQAFALASLRALRYIFSQLSLFHPAYGPRFDTVAGYVNWQEERAISQRAGRPQTAVASYGSLWQAQEAALARNDREDRRLAERRKAELPEQHAEVDRARLPVALHLVRRLDPNGTTRVGAYWQVTVPERLRQCERYTGVVAPPGRARLVAYGDGFRTDSTVADVPVEPRWDHPGRVYFALQAPVQGVALQVDGWTGPYRGVCTGVARTGPLAPLDPRAKGFEVSDLLPFVVTDLVDASAALASADFSADDVTPFLQTTLGQQHGLGVYFEVYAPYDLEANYVLEYEVTGRARGGLLRRPQTRTVLYQSRRALAEGRLPAALLIDRSEWEGADEVEIAVTVAHAETGATVRRTIAFATSGR